MKLEVCCKPAQVDIGLVNWRPRGCDSSQHRKLHDLLRLCLAVGSIRGIFDPSSVTCRFEARGSSISCQALRLIFDALLAGCSFMQSSADSVPVKRSRCSVRRVRICAVDAREDDDCYAQKSAIPKREIHVGSFMMPILSAHGRCVSGSMDALPCIISFVQLVSLSRGWL